MLKAVIAELNEAASLPRARGDVRLVAGLRGQETRIAQLYQKGSAKALLPQTFEAPLTAVLLNTAGGLTGGDAFQTQITAERGAHLIATTQTAERAYRALPGATAQVRNHLIAADDATLHWLPQETIFFDGAALDRRLDVDLAADARFVAVEAGVLGRAAMGETVRDLRLTDHWRIRRDGHLIFADALRLHGNPEELTKMPATLGSHLAFATLLLAAPDAARHLAPLRAILGAAGSASLVRPGVLAARLTAPDGQTLRRHLIPALPRLTDRPLPKTWSI
ncbi:MAG: urease accessory protein UreD [Pseudomonadota bacterium]